MAKVKLTKEFNQAYNKLNLKEALQPFTKWYN
jgi:hypothetical protein